MNMPSGQKFKSILFLAGAFTFAFLLAETVHESGHYLAHRLYGNNAIYIHLDPFGGSRLVGSTTLPEKEMIITSAAGPFSSLMLAIACFICLWKVRKPVLLPLLIWWPTAMIQEGVNMSLGLLSPNSDAQWIARSDMPTSLILIFGVILLLAGITGIAALLPLAGISEDAPLGHTWLVLVLGMCSLMLVRLVGAMYANPKTLVENMIPLAFSGILAFVAAVLHKPIHKITADQHYPASYQVSWNTTIRNLALGAGVFLLQLFMFN
jgi:hypothetical protein